MLPFVSRPVSSLFPNPQTPDYKYKTMENAIATDTDLSTPYPPTSRETVQLLTTPGPTRVTIVGRNVPVETPARVGSGNNRGGVSGDGGKKGRRLAVLTVHAVGHNHRTCFGALERELYRDEELGGGEGGVVFYHVDIPGHEEEQRDDVE